MMNIKTVFTCLSMTVMSIGGAYAQMQMAPVASMAPGVVAASEAHNAAQNVTQIHEAHQVPAQPLSAPTAYIPSVHPFDGLYVGVNGGFVTQSDELVVHSYNGGGLLYSSREKLSAYSGELGILLGGQKVIASIAGLPLYWGMDVGISIDFISPKKAGTVHSPATDNLQGYSIFPKETSYQINQKLGLLVTDCVGLYLKVGAVNSNFRYKWKSSDEVVRNRVTRKNLWGAQFGAGADFRLNEDWHVSAEYMFQAFQSFSHVMPLDRRAVAVAKPHVSPRYHRVTVGLIYKFS